MNPIYRFAPAATTSSFRALCFGAALFGVTWLALILFTLFYNWPCRSQPSGLHPEYAARRDRARAAC